MQKSFKYKLNAGNLIGDNMTLEGKLKGMNLKQQRAVQAVYHNSDDLKKSEIENFLPYKKNETSKSIEFQFADNTVFYLKRTDEGNKVNLGLPKGELFQLKYKIMIEYLRQHYNRPDKFGIFLAVGKDDEELYSKKPIEPKVLVKW